MRLRPSLRTLNNSMPINVADIRANLNENIIHAVNIIGKSVARRQVFEAVYRGKKEVKTGDEIADMTDLPRIRVLQEGGKLAANQIVEKTKKDGQTAYGKDEMYTHHKQKVLSVVAHPERAKKIPTKQSPRVVSTVYKITVPGRAPKIMQITVDDIDSFAEVRTVRAVDSSVRLNTMAEIRIKSAIRRIIGETHDFKDWGGEKNDLYTNRLRYKGHRYAGAFALKGMATQGTLTPKKMGKNGDQIARLLGSSAQVFFIVYHGKIDESIVAQLEAFALARSISGRPIYYGLIDGDDLNRLYQAYSAYFAT